MATLITEPASTNPQTVDWQALLSKLVKACGGAEVCRLTNWDNTSEPLVAAGSRFELNGSFFEVITDEAILGWAGISDGATAYVYATPSGSTAAFSYSSTAPAWDSAKGGWFNGTARALFKLYRTSSTVWANKRLMSVLDGVSGDWVTALSNALGSDWATAFAASAGAGILARLLTVDGAGSGLDADKLDGKESSVGNAADTVVVRGSDGSVSANNVNVSAGSMIKISNPPTSLPAAQFGAIAFKDGILYFGGGTMLSPVWRTISFT